MVDKGIEYHSRSIKSGLEYNVIKMYSTHNEGKSIAAERFIRTSKNKNYKYMTSVSKNENIDKLDNIVNKYNHTYRVKTVKNTIPWTCFISDLNGIETVAEKTKRI